VKAVLDTSVVLATGIGPLDGELAISAATIAELHFGILVTDSPEIRAERLRRLTVLLRTFDPLPLDASVAASYGQLAAAMAAKGRNPKVRVTDLLIAATAHVHGAILFTRHAEHLVGLEDLVEIVIV
jgi:predicted nucleic acid-binding protein